MEEEGYKKMSTLSLTETPILQYTLGELFLRGREYYRQGAVISLVRRGMTLRAEVQDSMPQPYVVRCIFGTDGAITATCTCHYHGSGWCKHIVATCLAAIHQPEKIEEHPTIEALLSDLNREQLQAMLVKLVEREPPLIELTEIETIKGEMPSLGLDSPEPVPPPPLEASPQSAQADSKVVRRQVRSIMHSLDHMRASEAYGYVGAVVNEVDRLLDQAWKLIKADNGRPALKLLEAITEEYISDWTELDDSDGELSQFFYELGPAWTEALLSADLSPEERGLWADQLYTWQDDISDYGVDDALAAAHQAALQGWDYPPLQRVLQGNITQQRAWDGEVPVCANDLAKARLSVLERRGRLQEYLYLAEAESQSEKYATMLVRLDPTQEAGAYARNPLRTAP